MFHCNSPLFISSASRIGSSLILCIVSPCHAPPWPRFLRRSIAIQLKAFPMLICAFLVIAFPPPCTRCFSLHCPRLPSLFISILRLALALLCMSIPLLFHSECRLAIQQHVLSTLCRNHAHLSVLCLRISLRFFASAQLRYPCFSFARLCNSLAHLLFASPSHGSSFLYFFFASLLPTSQVFAVTLHTLRIHCRAMRCQRNSLRFNSDAIPG